MPMIREWPTAALVQFPDGARLVLHVECDDDVSFILVDPEQSAAIRAAWADGPIDEAGEGVWLLCGPDTGVMFRLREDRAN